MFEIFDSMGFNIGDVIAICEYGGDIVIVKCKDCASGIYPDYETAHPLIMGWIYEFKLFNTLSVVTKNDVDIDAIIFFKEENEEGKEIVEIYFAEDSLCDGFQIISEIED